MATFIQTFNPHTHTAWFDCNEVEVKMKKGVRMI